MSKVILGITGGIATGKSTVIQMLASTGVPTLSSDEIAHKAILKGTPIYRNILKRFGRGLLERNGQISRQDLGNIVFKDALERKWLEMQIHPFVVRELKRYIKAHSGMMALDIPLLFEARLQSLVDAIVVVSCSSKQQLERLMKRNGLSRRDALQRIHSQWNLSTKRRKADVIIDNSGSLKDLQSQVRTFVNTYAKSA